MEPQSLVFFPNIPGLNPKFPHSEFLVKACVVLRSIRLLDGDVKHCRPLSVIFSIGEC